MHSSCNIELGRVNSIYTKCMLHDPVSLCVILLLFPLLATLVVGIPCGQLYSQNILVNVGCSLNPDLLLMSDSIGGHSNCHSTTACHSIIRLSVTVCRPLLHGGPCAETPKITVGASGGAVRVSSSSSRRTRRSGCRRQLRRHWDHFPRLLGPFPALSPAHAP